MRSHRLLTMGLALTALVLPVLGVFGLGHASAKPDRGSEIYYVDDDSTAVDPEGLSWSDAFSDLQDALDVPPEPGDEIRVAGGTYTPTDRTNPSDSRTVTFALISGVELRGGYRGLAGGGDPNEQDIDTYESILTGEIGASGDSDNAYHVVIASDCNDATVFDGFTVTKGHRDNSHRTGAGMLMSGGAPVLTNCTFTDNVADSGAGIYMHDCNSPSVTDCVFTWNRAKTTSLDQGSGLGGALAVVRSKPTVDGCMFAANGANWGGAIYADDWDSSAEPDEVPATDPLITDCVFIGNLSSTDTPTGSGVAAFNSNLRMAGCVLSGNWGASLEIFGDRFWGAGDPNTLVPTATLDAYVANCVVAGNKGGGVYMQKNHTVQTTMVNCLIVGNELADREGAGFRLAGHPDSLDSNGYPAVSATIVNCTFADNHAGVSQGGGVYLYDDDESDPNDPNLAFYNCIFWANVAGATAEEEDQIAATGGIGLTVEYSDIQDCNSLCPGTGNISDNPGFFVSESGTWTADGDYDSETYQVTFTDTGATWDTGELAGRLLNPETTLNNELYVIVSNTSTTVTVWADFDTICPGYNPPSATNFPDDCGDPNSWVDSGDTYLVYDYRLLSDCSPACKDAGDDSALPNDLLDLDNDSNTGESVPIDLDGDTRIADGDVDMGAYEYDGSPTCWGDLNLDGSVGLADLAILQGNYGETTGMGYFDGDMNCDGDVDLDDLAEFLGEYGGC